MLHLRSLGACEIDVGDTRLMPNSRTLFAFSLFLAVEGARPVVRERLHELFWPDADEEKANHSRRQMFYRLRTHGLVLDADAARVILPAGAVSTDFELLVASSASVAADDLLERIPGGFLPGYTPRGSPGFGEWVEEQRARVNAALRRHLVGGIGALRGAGDWRGVESVARRCLELDPLNEEATLALAEAIAMDGGKARAITIIDRYLGEVGPRAAALQLPPALLRNRISGLYPLPPVIERDPRQIGRDAEMSELDRALTDARAGRGSAFVISGGAGIGKTRLVTEFTRAAQLRGLRIARTNMSPHDDRRPLGAWSDLVASVRQMPGALGCDPESRSYLERLTAADVSDAVPSPDSHHAEFLFARIRLAVLDLLSAVASESCLILVIEDTQWLDEWSWDVMRALTKRLESTAMLVLMTRRDAAEQAVPVPPDAKVHGLPLAPLGDARCRELLALVGPEERPADAGFVEWCVRTSTGNPYFLIELGRRAVRTGGRFQAPPSLTSLISQRFLDVTPLSRRILQAAAVLGKNSTLGRIERVLDERPVSLLDGLDELARQSLILNDGARVLCRHDLLGMSASSEIAPLSLQLLHRLAAATLASEEDEGSAPAQLWDIAQHWEAAGERERAVAFLDLCAARALALGTPVEAARALEHAIPMLGAGGLRDDLRRRRIQALFLAQEYAPLIAAAEADRAGDVDAHLAPAAHTREELYELDARLLSLGPPGLIELTLACSANATAGADHRVGAGLIGIKAAQMTNDPGSARRLLANVTPALTAAEPRVAAEFRLVYEGTFGSVAAAAAEARALLGLLSRPEDWVLRARALLLCAMVFSLSGDREDARACLDEAVALGTKLQMPSAIRLATHLRFGLEMKYGELDRAERGIAGFQELERPVAGISDRGFRRNRVQLALYRGDYAAAERLLGPFDDIWAGEFPRERQFTVEGRARFLMRARGWVPERSDVDRLLEMHRAGRSSISHDGFVLLLVEAFEARGERARAEPLVREFVTRFRRERGPLMVQLSELLERLSIPVPDVPREEPPR